MGITLSKAKPEKTFKAAGCMFMDKTHILAGYQPNKKTPMISGFGGKQIGNESLTETALRETLEELFNLKEIPKGLVERIIETIQPRIIMNKEYLVLVYTFDQLVEILACSKYYIGSLEIYPDNYPMSVESLISHRVIDPSAEVAQLCILPLVKNLLVDPLFLGDINLVS